MLIYVVVDAREQSCHGAICVCSAECVQAGESRAVKNQPANEVNGGAH